MQSLTIAPRNRPKPQAVQDFEEMLTRIMGELAEYQNAKRLTFEDLYLVFIDHGGRQRPKHGTSCVIYEGVLYEIDRDWPGTPGE